MRWHLSQNFSEFSLEYAGHWITSVCCGRRGRIKFPVRAYFLFATTLAGSLSTPLSFQPPALTGKEVFEFGSWSIALSLFLSSDMRTMSGITFLLYSGISILSTALWRSVLLLDSIPLRGRLGLIWDSSTAVSCAKRWQAWVQLPRYFHAIAPEVLPFWLGKF